MEPLYQTYKDDGLAIAVFPCNQFNNQEPRSLADIKRFITVKYFGTYDVYAKIDVNGPFALPLFDFLKDRQHDADGGREIKWNFAKFIVNREGVPIRRYLPQTAPYEFEDDLVRILGVEKKEKPAIREPLTDSELAALVTPTPELTTVLP